MANYYTKFSFTVDVTPDQKDLLQEAEEEAVNTDDPEFPPRVKVIYDQIEEKERAVITHPDGGRGDPADAASLVQHFLQKAGSNQTVVFGYASTCHKPRIDAFGGGAAVVTKDGFQITSSFNEARQMRKIAERDAYRVEAEIDVDADSPEEAAIQAQEFLSAPDTTATVLDVRSPLKTTVDVAEEK